MASFNSSSCHNCKHICCQFSDYNCDYPPYNQSDGMYGKQGVKDCDRCQSFLRRHNSNSRQSHSPDRRSSRYDEKYDSYHSECEQQKRYGREGSHFSYVSYNDDGIRYRKRSDKCKPSFQSSHSFSNTKKRSSPSIDSIKERVLVLTPDIFSTNMHTQPINRSIQETSSSQITETLDSTTGAKAVSY